MNRIQKEKMPIISEGAVNRRLAWVNGIQRVSGEFSDDFDRVAGELSTEIRNGGLPALLDHLRLCGDIPESYGHDTSEEKLYSKYTDALLYETFVAWGLRSLVLTERADAADVEGYAEDYSFVADAKAFRLSRTAKNQKDFKVQAMDGWKRGKPFAMVVCPIYQVPTKSSQIYEQASSRNVAILTYCHLAVISSYAGLVAGSQPAHLLHEIFRTVQMMNPSKDSVAYWQAVNRVIFNFDRSIPELWNLEKRASSEGIVVAKNLALNYLAQARERIMRMSHQDALIELLQINKIESRILTIKGVSDTGLLDCV